MKKLSGWNEFGSLRTREVGLSQCLPEKRNELSELLHREKNVDAVKMKIMELDQAFVNFKGAHDVYTKSLVEESSITESREYFECEHCAVKGSQSFYLHLRHQLK